MTGPKGICPLVAGAFGAIRMGEPWSGAAIIGRRGDAGFGAGGGPPAGSVFGHFAHFGAAEFRLCVRATAVASAGGDVAEGVGRVRKNLQRSGQEKESERGSPEGKRAPTGGARGHGAIFCRVGEKNR